MIQLKLSLNSDRPSTVYSLNGKSYRLQPGSNVLNLEYEDYVSLAKALSIIPVEKPKEKKEEPKEEVREPERIEETKEEVKESEPVEDHKELVQEPSNNSDTLTDDNDNVINNEVENNKSEKELDKSEPTVEVVDYSTWSYNKLKAEYKRVTGNVCKLKKEDVIAFLQENNSNV